MAVIEKAPEIGDCNWVPCRWFAPSWTICTNSPFSPTTAPVQVTNLLNPTLKEIIHHKPRRHYMNYDINLQKFLLKTKN
ncbi:hypothetical protein EYZ02_10790 [Hafnia alvei]|nr:hypothetical protein EYZ02_10790 [Hafnia alvei]TBM15422.1 hypothetical protein EYY84_08970 [Hafnia alvei]